MRLVRRRSFLTAGLGLALPTPVLAVPGAHRGFEEVAARSGVRFRHSASKTSQKYLPETMGAGVAMFDYNNDGLLDLFFVNGAALRDPMPSGASPTSPIRAFGTGCTATMATALSPT